MYPSYYYRTHFMHFIKHRHRLKDECHTLFCAISCQPISQTLSFTISNITHPVSFSFPLSRLVYLFKLLLLSLIFFFRPKRKVPFSLVY
jgi:hypothetical protein